MENKEQDYKDSLSRIVKLIETVQVRTMVAANTQMLLAYWKIGQEISNRTNQLQWGSKVIDTLSKDIRNKFPGVKGFSPRNLLYMRQFADAYPSYMIKLLNDYWRQIRSNAQQVVALLGSNEMTITEFAQQPVAQIDEEEFFSSIIAKISWSHHVVLLDKCPSIPERFWYMLNTLEHGVSRNILLMQIESQLFHRQIKQKKTSNFSSTLPEPYSDYANYLLKDPYIFDFVQIKEKADERNIEEQLVKHITQFLLELGQGFAFVGRQYQLHVGDKYFYIDLLFYHIHLRCYVVVELKAREFDPGDPAKLNFYINVINDHLKSDKDNDTIGILLCKGKNKVVAEYALKGYNNPIGISDYELSKVVPRELKSTLPEIEKLENELREIDKSKQ